MPGQIKFEFRTAPGPATRRSEDAPVRLLLCGDFSGRASADAPDTVAQRPLHRVDVDRLDTVMARLAPRCTLAPAGTIGFRTLDDFHPDALFHRLDLFQRLRDLRTRLLDPARFEEARAELEGPIGPVTGGTPATGDPADVSDAATIERLLGQAPVAAKTTPNLAGTPEAAVEGLLQRLVRPHVTTRHAPEQAALIRTVDIAIAEHMRGLLHAPAFQALEAAWRTVHWLVSNLALDGAVELHLLDLSDRELATAAATAELQHSGLWQAVIEGGRSTPETTGWSMLVALRQFAPTPADLSALASLATVAAAAGAPCVASASPQLMGTDSWASLASIPTATGRAEDDAAALWTALRRSPLAPWIGLVAPRPLLRLPYGPDSDRVETFAFDEMAGADPTQVLLWGHGGAACALLLGLGVESRGWMGADTPMDIEDLPAWVHGQSGERQLYPVAEAWLGERASQSLLDQGLMPLLSRRDQPGARLLRWQSIAQPASPLAGLTRS